MRSLPHWLIYSVPLLAVLGLTMGGLWPLLAAAYVFVLIPLLEPLFGRNISNDGAEGPARRWAFDLPLLVWVPAQLALLSWALLRLGQAPSSMLGFLASAAAVGLVTGGIGITVSHEWMHRSTRWERALAEILLVSVCYPHFSIEHVFGHHKNVATPLDPATSRRGESVYAFLPRTLLGSLESAWAIERARRQRLGIGWFSLRNAFFRYALELGLVLALVSYAAGPLGLLFFAVQSAAAVLLLETINYVEHYGLRRQELEPGKYERVRPWHSWNASQRLTNWLLLNLQRHSDHHYLASRPYHQLRHYEEVPQLPAGYAAMIWLALIPPLWRRVMDPRVEQVRLNPPCIAGQSSAQDSHPSAIPS